VTSQSTIHCEKTANAYTQILDIKDSISSSHAQECEMWIQTSNSLQRRATEETLGLNSCFFTVREDPGL